LFDSEGFYARIFSTRNLLERVLSLLFLVRLFSGIAPAGGMFFIFFVRFVPVVFLLFFSLFFLSLHVSSCCEMISCFCRESGGTLFYSSSYSSYSSCFSFFFLCAVSCFYISLPPALPFLYPIAPLPFSPQSTQLEVNIFFFVLFLRTRKEVVFFFYFSPLDLPNSLYSSFSTKKSFFFLIGLLCKTDFSFILFFL
jgi:hypothetical protein